MTGPQNRAAPDLLHRHQIGELQCHIPMIISNHPDARPQAEFYGIPYHHIPVEEASKPEAERAHLELLERHSIDLIVLARAVRWHLEHRLLCYANKTVIFD